MKKLFTVLFAVFIVSALYAQSGRHDDYNRGSRGRYDERNNQSSSRIRMPDRFDTKAWLRARDAQVFDINREFDSRINAVRYRRNLKQREKRRLVAALERERHEQLDMVYRRFDERRMLAENNYRRGRMY